MRCRVRRCYVMLLLMLTTMSTYRFMTRKTHRHRGSDVIEDDSEQTRRRHSLQVHAVVMETDEVRRTLSWRRRRQCVAVLTGHPQVDGRLEYVVRLLRQLRQQIVVEDHVTDAEAEEQPVAAVGDDECQTPTDIHVYCDGDCGDILRSEFSGERWIDFRRLVDNGQDEMTTASQRKANTSASSRRPSSQYDTRTSTVSPDATSTATSASHPSRIENVFASTGSSNDRRRRPLTTVRLHPRGVGRRQFRRRDVGRENDEFVELSGIRFARNRWMSVSDNYRLMLDDLFINAAADNRTSKHLSRLTGNHATDSYCAVLEDDLVLAPDALIYLQAVERLMAIDPTVFTGSLFNDNSYPLYAADPSSFHRVSHFAGLGFVISRRRYIDDLRPAWAGHQNWDEVVQRLVARRRLVSVVPEVGRAVHVRRRLVEGSEYGRQPPRHPFESQRLNDAVLETGYDLTHMSAAVYDQRVRQLIATRPYVEYIEDALFFDDDAVVVCWRCHGDDDLDRMMTERHLWGVGNGGVVRGSYSGTMYFQYLTVLVLIVCRHSDFRSLRVAARPAYRLDGRLAVAAVQRRYLGIVYRLTADFRLVVGRPGESCSTACDRGNTTTGSGSSSSCDIRGLWLVNERCDVLRHFLPDCQLCIRASYEMPVDWALPGIAADNSGQCVTAYAHYISCASASAAYRRLCVCSR